MGVARTAGHRYQFRMRGAQTARAQRVKREDPSEDAWLSPRLDSPAPLRLRPQQTPTALSRTVASQPGSSSNIGTSAPLLRDRNQTTIRRVTAAVKLQSTVRGKQARPHEAPVPMKRQDAARGGGVAPAQHEQRVEQADHQRRGGGIQEVQITASTHAQGPRTLRERRANRDSVFKASPFRTSPFREYPQGHRASREASKGASETASASASAAVSTFDLWRSQERPRSVESQPRPPPGGSGCGKRTRLVPRDLDTTGAEAVDEEMEGNHTLHVDLPQAVPRLMFPSADIWQMSQMSPTELGNGLWSPGYNRGRMRYHAGMLSSDGFVYTVPAPTQGSGAVPSAQRYEMPSPLSPALSARQQSMMTSPALSIDDIIGSEGRLIDQQRAEREEREC